MSSTTEENESHALVSEAFELAETKLEQESVTVDDIEAVFEALEAAIDHPESDIWVTITAQGAKNQCEHHLNDEWRDPFESPRQTLENITGHEIEVTIE
ncbi:hypothetical protein [Natronosalvus amylolyticus]|uniref:hypothetical protein n=1 Tax=Natronosalvus amylolyticus TaxID=2961994 RepID=UPI0020C98501|nr:hypothetical protein [Natronosalvus amylolyticus]